MTKENYCAFGMVGDCGTESNTTVRNYVEQNISQTALNNILSTCGVSQTSSNIVKIDKVEKGCKVNVSQTNSAKNKCVLVSLLKAAAQSDAPIDVMNELSKEMQTQGFGTQTSTSTYVENTVKKYLSQLQINTIKNSCLVNQVTQNIIDIGECADEVNVPQFNESFNDCLINSLLEAAEQNGMPVSVSSNLKEKVEAEGISLLGALFGSSSSYVIIILVIGALAFAFFYLKQGGNQPIIIGPNGALMSSASSSSNEMMMYMGFALIGVIIFFFIYVKYFTK